MTQLKILFTAMDSQGHVNACIGLAKLLKGRGHHIIFTLAEGWESNIRKHGFEFIPLNLNKTPIDTKISSDHEDMNGNNQTEEKKKAPNQNLINMISQQLESYRKSPMESLIDFDPKTVDRFIDWSSGQFKFDEALQEVMDSVQPDMVILDFMMSLPCLIKGSIPWCQLWSCNPIIIYREACPPDGTGFPTNSPKELWREFRELSEQRFTEFRNHINQWLESKGVPPIPKYEPIVLFESPYMNIYNYPEALDYNDIIPRPAKWYRMDTLIREPDEKKAFTIPENLANKPGKLIFFSLGSMGSVDVDLMRNFIRVLAKSPHRFIVSKGPLHEQIKLPDNMWGERYVNQIAILPHVDVVITHGGNNTLTESLYFARPMIVVPIFFDQLDNAQRVHEKKLGIRLDTYHFKDEELLDSIEKLLSDDDLYQRLKKISEEIRDSNSREEVCSVIEEIAAGKEIVRVENSSKTANGSTIEVAAKSLQNVLGRVL